MNTWILLANKGNAIIYKKTKDKYDILEKFHNSYVFYKKDQIFSDRAGTTKTSYTNDMLSLNANHFDKENKRKFAKKIIQYLNKGTSNNSFNELIIVSSKGFIGDLRTKYTKPIKSKISNEISKCFYTEKTHELENFMKQEEMNTL